MVEQMQKFKWDKTIECERFHATLNASVCMLRFRSRDFSGCQNCIRGETLDEIYGALLDKDLENNLSLVKRLKNHISRLYTR